MNQTIEKVIVPGLPEPNGKIFSNCIRAGNLLVMAGMTASDGEGGVIGEGDVYQQSRVCLERVRQMVEHSGGSMSNVVKTVVYLTDVSCRLEYGKARDEFFQDPKPCSTLVGISALVQPELLVEIDATAYLEVE